MESDSHGSLSFKISLTLAYLNAGEVSASLVSDISDTRSKDWVVTFINTERFAWTPAVACTEDSDVLDLDSQHSSCGSPYFNHAF